MKLDQASEELMEHARTHIFDPLKMKKPEAEYARDVEWDGGTYHILLTKLDFITDWAYMLSISKMSAGGIPSDDEADSIAQVFFPLGGYFRLDKTELQNVSKSFCAKFLVRRSK